MNRRNFLSSLLALIPLPFLRWKKKDPKEVFKETVGKCIEAEVFCVSQWDEPSSPLLTEDITRADSFMLVEHNPGIYVAHFGRPGKHIIFTNIVNE